MATTGKRVEKAKSEPSAEQDAARPGGLRLAAPPSVGAIRGRLGLSRKLFSRLAGFSERAIADWEGASP